MQNYILNRLKIDAAHVLNLADNEKRLQHPGLKGRFRELLINNLLNPWLPPYVSCGTGMIIDALQNQRQFTQEDIILYDKSLTPPVLASPHFSEGVFFYNSVIARIEVKSILNKAGIDSFVHSSKEIANLRMAVWPGFEGNVTGTLNMLFAFSSNIKNSDHELERFKKSMQDAVVGYTSGIISVICIAGSGLWKISLDNNNNKIWTKLNSTDAIDHITWFVACISNICYQEHARRQGRPPELGVECGIGMFIPGDVWITIYNP
jgi:hypothetical protein